MAEATKRFAVVIGTNKGIGLETVKQLASKARLFEGLGLSGEQCRDWSQTRC
ncbi:hypothetical protein CerSpe_072870 [Prunus speciosa]